MKQYLRTAKEPNLQKVVIASAVLHLLFIALVIVPIKTKEREYKSYFVNLVGPSEIRPRAARVPAKKKSVKGKTGKTAVKAKPPLKKRVRPKSKADMSLEPAERAAKEIERLRAISALSKKKKQQKADEARTEEADAAVDQAIDVIRKKKREGSVAGVGIPGVGSSLDSESYYALVTAKIWSEWIYPDFDASGLEVIISIRIGKDGKVISQEIEKSSGNSLFDRSASKAVSKASPLPPPAVEMEIGVRFYL